MLYFIADSGTYHGQLWQSDGTAAGTKLLKVICPTQSPFYDTDPYYTPLNNKLYFTANDNISGTQIWLTDGTTAGTTKVTNIDSAIGGFYPSQFLEYNNKLFFEGKDANQYYQRYVTDGTAGGTVIVKSDSAQVGAHWGFQPNYMTVFNGLLYMSGSDSAYKTQVWKSDGTTAGTQRVTAYPYPYYGPRNFTVLGNRLVYLAADTITQATEVWISDGTPSDYQTYNPGGVHGVDFTYTSGFIPFNNALYFSASYYSAFDYQLNRVVLSTVGVDEVNKVELSIYPNPATGKLFIKTGNTQPNTTGIYDLSGRLLFTQPFKSELDISRMANGIYIIEVTGNGETARTRFIKM